MGQGAGHRMGAGQSARRGMEWGPTASGEEEEHWVGMEQSPGEMQSGSVSMLNVHVLWCCQAVAFLH